MPGVGGNRWGQGRLILFFSYTLKMLLPLLPVLPPYCRNGLNGRRDSVGRRCVLLPVQRGACFRRRVPRMYSLMIRCFVWETKLMIEPGKIPRLNGWLVRQFADIGGLKKPRENDENKAKERVRSS